MITASIVTFHHKTDEIKQLINCLINSKVDRIFIIDNSSHDLLRVLENESPKIRYIHSQNVGYGKGHNIVINEINNSPHSYHIIINPDISLKGEIIEELFEYMEKHIDIGLLMPKILYPSGKIQYLCKLLPTPIDLFSRRFIFIKSIQRKIQYKYELRFVDYTQEMEVPSLSGCFMFLRNNILKQVNGFDKRYFMYAEDLDLCRKIGEISKLIYYPKVHVYHAYEKGSYKSLKLLRYHIVSIIKYFNKWGWFFDSKRKDINKKTIYNLTKKQ